MYSWEICLKLGDPKYPIKQRQRDIDRHILRRLVLVVLDEVIIFIRNETVLNHWFGQHDFLLKSIVCVYKRQQGEIV